MMEPAMGNVVENVTETVVEHEEVFYQSAEFWVSVVFVLVVGILFMPAVRLIKNMTRQRIERIKGELSDAENLQIDAQKLYADYERKFINAEKETEEIIVNQQNFISQMKENKFNELDQLLNRKQNEVNARIELASEQLKTEINTKICQKALNILYQVIKSKLTKNDYNKLIDDSIKNIKKIEIGGENG